MIPLLVDTDAFICARKLGLLLPICRALPGGKPVTLGEYVARRELSSLSSEVDGLVLAGHLKIEAVERRGDGGARFLELRRGGLDIGEAEELAWALGLEPAARPMFVSLDVRARKVAAARKVPCGDVMELVIHAVEAGVVERANAAAALNPWEDRRNQFGRPPDFTTFAETYESRLSRRR